MGIRLAAALLSGALGTGGAFALPTPGQEIATAQIAQIAATCLPADKVPTATAIKLAESHHRFDEVNDNPATGDLSYGGWQINMIGGLGPARRAEFGLASNDDLLDPVTNARVMCELSGGGENWAPWTTYTTGEYLDYLPEAEAAAGQVSGVPLAAARPTSPSSTGAGSDWPSLGDVAEGAWQQVGKAVHAVGGAVNKGNTPELGSIYNSTLGQIHGSYTPTATGGGVYTPAAGATVARSEGMQPAFVQQLARLFAAAPGAVAIGPDPGDGFRTVDQQQSIVAAHDGVCGKWVACVTNGVCGSMHCQGLAADLTFGDDATDQWVHAHLSAYGLCQPMSYEPWHVQPADTCKTSNS